jgi:hypothetical protein
MQIRRQPITIRPASHHPTRHEPVVLTCTRSYDLFVQESEANRVYAICATILVAVAAFCFILDSGWIDKVLDRLR